MNRECGERSIWIGVFSQPEEAWLVSGQADQRRSALSQIGFKTILAET